VFLAVLTLICITLLERGQAGFWAVLFEQLALCWKWVLG
jgi:hypothetical protein